MFQPVIPWIGGKRRLAKEILPMFPKHTCYCEPFCGGAALFFLKEPSKVEVLNDFSSELVALYRVLQHHLEEFIRQYKWALVSRQMFEWMTDTPPTTLTEIQRAARFFYLQKMAFGGKVARRTFGTATASPPRLNLTRIEEDLSQAHMRLARCYIENLDWEKCIGKYDRPGTLFFLDPPYWKVEGYGVPFGIEQYQRMAELMRTMKGKAILTINNHPVMKEVFAGFDTREVEISYTVGGGGKSNKSREMVIKTWA
ncbi:restriction endonuclease subunit M [Geomonas limicola]|uniref:site-specific DNA-methyltransferase (adenine-specific) n=1 Tax=Geomonas limicola TaxID=2740186 RepID=A0A6V8N9D7_9BACT|nr:DNA adenine methylase [Geomonas limicola]GFO67869.1 restriction endonuclease subunit M [Geomonas limicola]